MLIPFDTRTPDERSYPREIQKAVLALTNRGSRSLGELCVGCSGAFPTEIAAAVARLQLTVETGQEMGRESTEQVGGSKLEPSPVDYEWRFTSDSAKVIANLALTTGKRILCLGTPSVAGAIASRRTASDCLLIDRNPFVATGLQDDVDVLVRDISDLSDTLRSSSYDVVVLDPPWYRDQIEHWFEVACFAATESGTIVMTLIPDLARPSAKLDREVVLEHVSSAGKLATQRHLIFYETPLFEQETLTGLGLPLLPEWRATDVAVVKLRRNRPRTQLPLLTTVDHWNRFRFGTQLVALRDSGDDPSTITVSSIYPDGGFLRRTVSNREPAKDRISFWTSRNRVASVTGLDRVGPFLLQLEHGATVDDASRTTANDRNELEALQLITALMGC